MPEAHVGYVAPQARIPRTLFAHFHESGDNTFPPNLAMNNTVLTYHIVPDNWNGLDALVLWLLGGVGEAITINVTVDVGSCDELFNVHTQTVNAIAVTLVLNEYECVDLTATFAVVLANLAARDIIRVTVTHASGDNTHRAIGIEVQET